MAFRVFGWRSAGAGAWAIAVAVLALAAIGAQGGRTARRLAGGARRRRRCRAGIRRRHAGIRRAACRGRSAGGQHPPAQRCSGRAAPRGRAGDAENLLRRIAELPVRPGGRCFVFLTSHGERDAGLWLARSNRALAPSELAQALSRGCAAVPTVVVVSGCYTGGFAAGAMARPNRIILTAARRDRPSFGCEVGRTYTVYDQCLLAALPKAARLAGGFRPDQELRQPKGARAGRAAIRTAGLFRLGGRRPQRRLLI